MLNNKTIVVTGAASGIGAETVAHLKRCGAKVIGVDRYFTDQVDELIVGDLSEVSSIDKIIELMPEDIDGVANIAGLPPTAPSSLVLKVNFLGLRYFTNNIVNKMSDGASIVNLASLAGFGWADQLDQVKQLIKLSLNDDIEAFCEEHKLNEAGGRSYFLSKEALNVWSIQSRWKWRDRNITMNNVSPGPVDTPILKDFISTLGARAEEDMKIMDRPGHPTDIAPVVSFMLSSGAKWFRGSNLCADGGMSSHILSNRYSL
jgi:NAD(P)-dependent dehydrogenase (short-subunit alcohol dehydrogenase family)